MTSLGRPEQPEPPLSEEHRCAAALLCLAQDSPIEQYTSKRPSLPDTSVCTSTILNEALSKLTTALARLHRAGGASKRKSEAFWTFIAGSWSRSKLDEQVCEARKKLPKALSAEDDLITAKALVDEAVAMLFKGDVRDAKDLEAAKRAFERGTLW